MPCSSARWNFHARVGDAQSTPRCRGCAVDITLPDSPHHLAAVPVGSARRRGVPDGVDVVAYAAQPWRTPSSPTRASCICPSRGSWASAGRCSSRPSTACCLDGTRRQRTLPRLRRRRPGRSRRGRLHRQLRNNAGRARPRTAIVHADVAEEFGRRLADAFAAYPTVGDDARCRRHRHRAAHHGRGARRRPCALVRDAAGAGARILTGGELPDRPGFFYPPTVVAGCRRRGPCWRRRSSGRWRRSRRSAPTTRLSALAATLVDIARVRVHATGRALRLAGPSRRSR